MSVWFAIPSCREAPEAKACLDRWREMGYKIAILRQGQPIEADLVIPTGEYLGWARSTNILAREVLRRDRDASWIIGGGDDYLPDSYYHPHEIALQNAKRFMGSDLNTGDIFSLMKKSTFGVVQPTGDRWGDSESSRATYGENRGAIIDRVAGSPWMGREWIERSYLGDGPMWSGYHHCFADEELLEVATTAGVYWARPDLTQYHDHASRKTSDRTCWPAHLEPAITGANWDHDYKMFAERKAKGFPGSQSICHP